ncbi:MAG: DUF4465 domain-containing protein [Bacteroidales bacterium]|nr:DUF4465 domain-containing protein [Bacteroidales bacterium]
MKKIFSFTFFVFYAFAVLPAQSSFPAPSDDYEISDFENLSLEPYSFWNGSDLSGVFNSGILSFPNFYNESWGSWSGWAYSNMADDSTAGFMNQYSAITGSGFDTIASSGSNYGVAYVPVDFMTTENIPVPIYFSDSIARVIKGFFVTNSTYAALSMEFGDDFTRKFGGESGDDPDFLKLSVFGFSDGNITETIDFYLADFRFEDNTEDYIVKTWQWLELSSLGEVDSLFLNLASSDAGIYGMNTPGYFCIDQIYVLPSENSGIGNQLTEKVSITIFPNPAAEEIRIKTSGNKKSSITIFGLFGKEVLAIPDYEDGENIPVQHFDSGVYVVKIENQEGIYATTFVKK